MNERAAETVFVALPEGATRSQVLWATERLEELLPQVSWRAHLFVLGGSGGADREATVTIAETVARHLQRFPLAAVHLHPLLPVGLAGEEKVWIAELLQVVRPFQEEAFAERSEPRCGLHPLLMLEPGTAAKRLRDAAEVLHARAATPAVVVAQALLPEVVPMLGRLGLRAYVIPGSVEPAAVMGQVRAGHVVESTLATLEDGGGDVLGRCRPHRVLDAARGELFPCLTAHGRNGPALAGAGTEPAGLPSELVLSWCPSCVAESALAAEASVAASDRAAEGSRLCRSIAAELASRSDHHGSARLAIAAGRLAQADGERAAAALLAGLAQLGAGELEQAEQALLRAGELGEDRRLVAFHRGRVQMAWRDWIEAGDRFAEALAHPSSTVPDADIRFQAALCHINLEEYAEARQHLEATWRQRRQAPVAFYRGVCALAEGDPPQALGYIEEALALRPVREDLGRVLLYKGLCLCDLDRWEEAVTVLREAVTVDSEDNANRHQLGFCLYILKRHEEAARCFAEIVERDPHSALDWANLGSNLRELGRADEAIAAYEKALSLDPGIGFARTSLQRLSRARGDGK